MNRRTNEGDPHLASLYPASGRGFIIDVFNDNKFNFYIFHANNRINELRETNELPEYLEERFN